MVELQARQSGSLAQASEVMIKVEVTFTVGDEVHQVTGPMRIEVDDVLMLQVTSQGRMVPLPRKEVRRTPRPSGASVERKNEPRPGPQG